MKRGLAGLSSPKERFTVTLGVLVLILLSTMQFSSNNETITGNAVQNIIVLKSGQHFDLAVKDIEGIEVIQIHVAEDVSNAQVFVEEVKNPAFEGKEFSSFMVSAEKIVPEKLIFDLRIQKEQLATLYVHSRDIRLFQDNQEVPTTFVKEGDDFYFYTAEAAGFGTFTIGARVIKPTQNVAGHAILPPTRVEPENEPAQEETVKQKKGFFENISNFFRNLFGSQ